MPDLIDHAQAHELRLREQNIKAAQAGLEPSPGPIFIDGEACCRECEEPISPQRLAVIPDACLCIHCARQMEK